MKQPTKPVRVPDFLRKKQKGDKITILTAYDATMARLRALVDEEAIAVIVIGRPIALSGRKTASTSAAVIMLQNYVDGLNAE